MGKENSKLKPEVVQDLAQTTEFTDEEIRVWYKRFMKNCPSGHLTVQGLKEVYGRIFPRGDASKFVEHVFRTFDANGDGTIDFREFMCSMSVNTRGTVEEKLTWAFNAYDLDGSGYISRSELFEVTSAFFKMKQPDNDLTPESLTDKLVRQMDKDFDGEISLAEFIEGAKNDMALVSMIVEK